MQRKFDTRVSREEVSSEPKLFAAHFKTIATATLAFDEYLQEARGQTSRERAYNNMERADDYLFDDTIAAVDESNVAAMRRTPSAATGSPQLPNSRENDMPLNTHTFRRRGLCNQSPHLSTLSPTTLSPNHNSMPQVYSHRREPHNPSITTSVDPKPHSQSPTWPPRPDRSPSGQSRTNFTPTSPPNSSASYGQSRSVGRHRNSLNLVTPRERDSPDHPHYHNGYDEEDNLEDWGEDSQEEDDNYDNAASNRDGDEDKPW